MLSSRSFSSPTSRSCSVASASRPRRIGSSKRRRNSDAEPVPAAPGQHAPRRRRRITGPRTQQRRIAELHQRKVLRKVVLDRRAGQQHTTPRLQPVQRLVRLAGGVLQSMALVAQHHAHGAGAEQLRMLSERLVANDQYGLRNGSARRGHPGLQCVRNALARSVDGQHAQAAGQPLVHFALPVLRRRRQRAGTVGDGIDSIDDRTAAPTRPTHLHQRRRAHDHGLLNDGPRIGPLP